MTDHEVAELSKYSYPRQVDPSDLILFGNGDMAAADVLQGLEKQARCSLRPACCVKHVAAKAACMRSLLKFLKQKRPKGSSGFMTCEQHLVLLEC